MQSGLLTEKGYSVTRDGKKVSKYTSLFKNVKIDIQDQNLTVKVQPNADFLKESYLMQIVQANKIGAKT